MKLERHSSLPPANYKPDKGLKSIAIAEAMERHYHRAKDATRLLDAVELKLAEQRKFVLWWDGQTKQTGARGFGKKVALQTGNATLGTNGLPDGVTVHRWRTRLKDEKAFEVTLQKAQTSCIKVCEARQGHSDYARATNTGEIEWYTPAEYLAAARDVLGEFDLDPASSETAQRTVKAARYFTKTDDGLAQEWLGRVWLNPPYAQPWIEEFVAKLTQEYAADHVTAAILLTNSSTDTAWFHLAASRAKAVCFTRGRISFLDQRGDSGSPLQGQAFFYYGADLEMFVKRFVQFGLLVKPL